MKMLYLNVTAPMRCCRG